MVAMGGSDAPERQEIEMLVSATPPEAFVGKCVPCVYPVRITDPTVVGDTARVDCPGCAQVLKLDRLYGTKTAELCDPRCMGATGPSCSCSCGGGNHGGNYTLRDGEITATALAEYRAQVAKREDAADRRAAAKARKERAAFDVWAAANADVVGFLGNGDRFAFGSDDPNDFLYEMAGHTGRYATRRALTDNQANAVRRCMAGRERFEAAKREREANAKPCPTGPAVEVVGEVVKAWYEEGFFNGREVTRWLMTVRCDGYEVRMTIPKALQTGETTEGDLFGLKGRRVSVTAAVELSRQSASYGYGKRPRAARFL
jgi:hypothetical protein